MPINLKDIASISGMSGLYRIVSPTRSGVIIETLDDKANRQVAQSKHRISLLHEISIYTEDAEVTVPLADVFERIHQKYNQETPVNSKSSNNELYSFIQEIIPDYDRSRVYVSDIKKLVNWYAIVSKYVPFTEAESTSDSSAADEPALTEQTAVDPESKKS